MNEMGTGRDTSFHSHLPAEEVKPEDSDGEDFELINEWLDRQEFGTDTRAPRDTIALKKINEIAEDILGGNEIKLLKAYLENGGNFSQAARALSEDEGEVTAEKFRREFNKILRKIRERLVEKDGTMSGDARDGEEARSKEKLGQLFSQMEEEFQGKVKEFFAREARGRTLKELFKDKIVDNFQAVIKSEILQFDSSFDNMTGLEEQIKLAVDKEWESEFKKLPELQVKSFLYLLTKGSGEEAGQIQEKLLEKFSIQVVEGIFKTVMEWVVQNTTRTT